MIVHAEDALQRAVVSTLRLSPDLKMIAIPNGGKRGKVEAARMHGLGVMAGVSDLMILWPVGGIAFIELKRPGLVTGKKRPLKSLRPEQLAFYGWCSLNGFSATVCDSVEMVEDYLRSCGAPVRTRTGRAA